MRGRKGGRKPQQQPKKQRGDGEEDEVCKRQQEGEGTGLKAKASGGGPRRWWVCDLARGKLPLEPEAMMTLSSVPV